MTPRGAITFAATFNVNLFNFYPYKFGLAAPLHYGDLDFDGDNSTLEMLSLSSV